MAGSNKTREKLKNLECPFTWGMNKIDEVVKNHEETKTHDDEESVPILKWMRLLVHAYESVVKNYLTEANKCIVSAEEFWDYVKAEHADHISLNVLDNIFKGTKCYVELEAGHLEEVKQILESTLDVNYKASAKDRSTLNGCKCLAWSKYKDAGNLGIGRAIHFAELAIKDNPNFAVWHFMFAKNWRRQRRIAQCVSKPSVNEEKAFEKAYELSSKPIYGIFFAQCHKEKRNLSKALSIYKKIFNTKPESCAVRLRLALGFIRQRELKMAKECLDYVEERFPNDCMFLHYKGIYLETLCNYKEAAEYFLKAHKEKNYGAAMSYLKCKAKLRDGFDFVQYLEEMFKTYATFEDRDLDILLQIAACSYFCDNDLPGAAKYYLQAFEKYPNNRLYQCHECVLGGKSNVYDFLRNDFLKKAFACRDLDSGTKAICEKLKDCCDKKYNSNRKSAESSFSKMKL
ncbi:interferon-induced protein with tetratricopeptide repeats 2-like [Belonocnema kinseyi]|uniref:interferon-induced protein with tetratricopeptide repeats 2-like n=1 Tax=Belonocnema kinseyi TaxID=2817044 RepID=UPI00143CE802|nr:interferon-induced protein with tetratricopeptide repeats 2-like [Belonocnema kinseyi]XP_033225061.1 interferon-induced protein with tetratricopeptide repeats 2-like [Belonocnema kinseyi]XP_033225062.1 interferon-induced protein with tetratricopeptide repeats 2-like [Belonocnema kinseyi]XP_033225063.1 interferon-induced protein with tetratricopeptide repeats 2-like [Belonocnema kinseyi]